MGWGSQKVYGLYTHENVEQNYPSPGSSCQEDIIYFYQLLTHPFGKTKLAHVIKIDILVTLATIIIFKEG